MEAWVRRCDRGGVWLVVPGSTTHSITGVGRAGTVELKQSVRDWRSHSPNHDVEGSDWWGGGRVNEGPGYCTEMPYRGAVKKACDINQYEAPPMDRSKDG
jgi:hypothetical protein